VTPLTHASRDQSKHHPAPGQASAQEAHMRAALNIVLVATGILISIMVRPYKTVAITTFNGEGHNVAVVHGLHVAIPDDMKTFPADLVPLP
jgi:hypothetical protein